MGEHEEDDRSQAFIDENLKRVFQQTIDEDLPDRFKELLEKLRRQEDAKSDDVPKINSDPQ
ncbi:NepR family anti-sigma factor [Marivita sp. S0852]|uniref:NepR family anti-sigma factor n=1 Tax=Marivita sp. S0852 TaxID=3373893 RepID=UPI003981CB7F